MARQNKFNSRDNQQPSEHPWSRKMPYDFTGCIAHVDITFNDIVIQRITGITEHNEECKTSTMK